VLRNPILDNAAADTEAFEAIAPLVARARAGDSAAFATLYRRYVTGVYAFTARRLSDRDRAEEATQEIFTRALEGIGRCRDDAAFPGWLFGIAHHVVTEQYKAGRHVTSPLESASESVDPDRSPEESALSREGADELRRAREGCLNERERVLFDLLLADLTDAQIAAALGKRAGAIRMAHWRLLIKLRGCLGMLARLGGIGHASV
jgi:RNA polymerase sigma-70 factor (ECF subfamily)